MLMQPNENTTNFHTEMIILIMTKNEFRTQMTII